MRSPERENPHGSVILAEELRQGWDSSDRLPDRIGGYSTLKERTEQFTDWARDGGIPVFDKETTRTFRKVETCGSYLLFRVYLTSKRARLMGACSCKEHLLCAFCAARRGVKNAVAYKERVELLQKENRQRLMFLTFTVKNGPNLWERFTHLRSSIQRMLRRRTDAAIRNTPSTLTCLNGGVFAYEFKRGSGSDEWHPHIHMLALIDLFHQVDIEAIKQEWHEITGDSCVVNIKPCTDDAAFLEVFAYALKFSEMEHSDRWSAFKVLKGERLISSFGSMRGVQVPESLNDDLLESEEPWADLIFRYRRNAGYDKGQVIDQSHKHLEAA